MKTQVILIFVIIFLAGCTYSISDIEVDNLEPACVRECSSHYSLCVSQENRTGFNNDKLWACKEAYKVCVNTCPAR